ncbi:glycerophosphodiester phosphodiesterase [Mytilus galloprovincialis]|uniref:Glycerophosphodiester phosphodiesterase n=1 Tax=Mytilus galloprovincialis TaxID=29158 RepID=A0A8B6HH89_MYTGA|nr:glycerophosphodiester phosphodiesterase [Mytilus galloprovincialis]
MQKNSPGNYRNAKNLKGCVHAIMSTDFTQLQNNGPLPVLAFGLLILFDNFVKKELFKDKWEDTEKVISTLMKECSNNCKPSQNDILSTFNDLEGAYLIENEVSFKAINSIIYDCIVSNVGRHFCGSILELAADSFLIERIKFESLKLEDQFNSILLPQILENKYFKRIVIILQHGKFKDAFSNVQSNDTEYRSKFINYCRISETDLSRFTESADGLSFLHVCAKFGFADIARFILQNNNEHDEIVGKIDNYWKTPLQEACVYGFREIVNVLLEYKSAIHIKDNNTLTPLHLCCKHGHAELVELLIHEGADISLCSAKQGTPIFIAVHNNCLDVIRVLLRNNADVNNGSESGKTPLHDACENNRTDIVNILVDQKKAGVDINKSDKDGRTPLYITCQKGYIDLAKILIFNKHGKAFVNKADVNGLAPIHIAVSEKHFSVTELLLREIAAVDKRSKQGHTPLYFACENGDMDIVKLLLRYRADINGRNEICSRTPLYKAYEHEHYNIVKCLLEQETAIRLSNYKYMFLFTTCLMGDVNAVKDLLQNNKIFFNINCIKYGETVLSIASKKGFPKLVELLLQHNHDINFHSKSGWTALCLACKSGSKNTVEFLLRHKASVHIATKSRMTALFISCLYGHSHLIEPLIRHGANVDEGDHHGWTPLKISCYLGDTEMVKILLKCKAKVDLEDEVRWKGERKTHIKIKRKNHIPHMVIEHKRKVHNYFKIKQTPLCISCAQGDETTINELIDAGADINQGGETDDFASTLEACDKYVESRLRLSQICSKEKFDETEKTYRAPNCML